MPTVRLSEPVHAADAASYLRRLLRFEPAAYVRVRARGRVLGVFARPPFGVVALRAVPLAEDAFLDVTVAAGDLAASLEPASSGSHGPGDGVDVSLAAARPLAWTGALPPERGWAPVARADVGSVLEAVRAGVREFRARCEGQVGRADAERVADELWDRPVLQDLPLRAAHAAYALGFLGSGGVAAAFEHPAWHRLDGPYGSVVVRRSRELLHPLGA